jgi:DNA-binding GntR family transcriptional regulator
MRAIDTSLTVEQRVFDEIRDAILTGHLEPGARLRLRELADELNVSSLPVRAALARLRAEGLVQHAPRSGSIVAPIEFEELEEIQAFRLGIESLAARLGAEHIGKKGLDAMRRRLETVDGLAQEHDLDRYLRAEASFRETCYVEAERPRLLGYVRQYRLRAERYLRVVFSTPEGLASSTVYQHQLLDACRLHDGVRAEAVTRDALEWTKETLRAQFEGRSPGVVAADRTSGL